MSVMEWGIVIVCKSLCGDGSDSDGAGSDNDSLGSDSGGDASDSGDGSDSGGDGSDILVVIVLVIIVIIVVARPCTWVRASFNCFSRSFTWYEEAGEGRVNR